MDVDELDTDKLITVPVELRKLSNIVKNYVIKKIVYDELVTKVNAIDISEFVFKTQYNTDKLGVD